MTALATAFCYVLLRSSRDPGRQHGLQRGAIHSSARQTRPVARCLDSFWIFGYFGRSKLGHDESKMSEHIVTLTLNILRPLLASIQFLYTFAAMETLPGSDAVDSMDFPPSNFQSDVPTHGQVRSSAQTVLTCHTYQIISIKNIKT